VSDIVSLDNYLAAAKQRVQWCKTAPRTTVAAQWFSLFELAGEPGAGTLAGTSTTAGVVPTDATAGCPVINAFGASATGRLSKVEFGNTVACRMAIFDCLFKAGAFAFNASQALSAQPSFASRVPGGDYKGLELWVETVTAATGNQAVTVTYTDESGNAGASTGAVGIGSAPTVGRCWQLPLASGDSGVQLVSNVVGSVATVGTFNVLVMRPLWSGRVRMANDGDVHDLLRTGMPQVFTDSALMVLISADSTSSGVPELSIEIANG
jgi:hypothetical protein